MVQFDQYTLGQTDSELKLSIREEHQLATVAMLQQARRQVDIVSRDLDATVYDHPAFIDALRSMILNNRRTRVRIIVFDAQTLSRRGHQLLQLATDLSSFIAIREGGQEHASYSEAMLVADSCGYIHRYAWDRYEANANFNNRHRCRALLNTFESMWDQAASSVHLRRLSI